MTEYISDRKLSLTAIRLGDQIALSTESKEALKGWYRKTLENNSRSPVDIEIDVPNTHELSELIIQEDVVWEFGIEFAEHMAEQFLLKSIKWKTEPLETAIEYLLQDEMIDSCAIRMRELYVKKYDAKDLAFTDSEGIKHSYWTAFLWIDIIEELLKELLFSRSLFYANSRRKDFIKIDCFYETRSGKQIWSFPSFISKEFTDEDFMNKIRMPGWRGDYSDIPANSLAFHVYPDLFYSIGLLKANRTAGSFEVVNQHEDVFNLLHYFIGLH